MPAFYGSKRSTSVVGKILTRKTDCPLALAKKLEQVWSNLITTCPRARGIFRLLAGVSAKRTSEIRLFCWHDIITQIYDYSAAVHAVITDPGDFAPELRGKLRDLIAPAVLTDLRMELAIAKDVGALLVKLCIKQEGDSPLLCTTTYIHWHSVLDNLRDISQPNTPIATKRALLPSVTQNATAIGGNAAAIDFLIDVQSQRMLPVYEKMRGDSEGAGRLVRTLAILRACRLFNWEWVAATPLKALIDEMVHVTAIPRCYDHEVALAAELEAYKARADQKFALPVDDRPSLWDFFTAAAIALPTWWKCAREVALITPSSCTVERVFSLLTQGFSDNQEGALEDYIFASVMVRYNAIWAAHDQGR